MAKATGLNNSAIKPGQAGKLLFMFAMGSSSLILPTAVTVIAKQDSWISMLLVGPVNYLVMMIYLALADRFPGMSLAQYAQKVIGVRAGKLLSLTFIFFYLLLSALVLRNISDFLTMSVLPRTPFWFIDVSFMLVVIYGVYLGIETIARTGEILFAWGLSITFVILISLGNQLDLHNLEPLLYNGIIRPIKGTYPIIGFPIAEFVCFTSILPLVGKEFRPKLRKAIKLSFVCVTGSSTILTVFLIGVMGVDEVSRSPFSFYDMAKYINIEEILVRVEIMVAMVWFATVFSKLVICVYVLSVTTAHVLELSTYRPVIVPYAFIIVPLSVLVYRNVAHTKEFTLGVWTLYASAQGILIPLLLLAIAAIRGIRDSSDGRLPPPKQLQGVREEGAGDSSSGQDDPLPNVPQPQPRTRTGPSGA